MPVQDGGAKCRVGGRHPLIRRKWKRGGLVFKTRCASDGVPVPWTNAGIRIQLKGSARTMRRSPVSTLASALPECRSSGEGLGTKGLLRRAL